MDEPIRVGAVSYLNTRPLVYGLDRIAPQIELVYDLPSRLADQLARGQLDVALIPSIEYFQHPEYTIVSDACIGCRGPVLSVRLFCRVEPSKIRTLALDEGSRTSVALVRILLQQRFGIAPDLQCLPLGAELPDTRADAVLLIGDRAMRAADDSITDTWDLGDQWCRWTKQPFVFAMWVSRPKFDLLPVEAALCEARDAGVAHLSEIADREAASVGLDTATCLSYLRDNLYFHLGPSQRRGLELFYHYAADLGLAPNRRNLKFHDLETA